MTAFELRFANYSFAPNLIPLIATIIVIPILLSLGLWQLDRADEKRVMDKTVQEAISKKPLNVNFENIGQLETEIYRKTTIEGYFDSQNQMLLDNRTHLGKPGYHVISPFIFENKGKQYTILVNRGWIGYKGTRDNIPDISIDKAPRTLTGSIKALSDAIVLSGDEQTKQPVVMTSSNYKLIQSIQLENLQKLTGYSLLPVVIELNKEQENGFIRVWKPYYGSIDKHNAYALQWFAMAIIVLFLFIRLNIKKLNFT